VVRLRPRVICPILGDGDEHDRAETVDTTERRPEEQRRLLQRQLPIEGTHLGQYSCAILLICLAVPSLRDELWVNDGELTRRRR
jgi:hypothetical protein